MTITVSLRTTEPGHWGYSLQSQINYGSVFITVSSWDSKEIRQFNRTRLNGIMKNLNMKLSGCRCDSESNCGCVCSWVLGYGMDSDFTVLMYDLPNKNITPEELKESINKNFIDNEIEFVDSEDVRLR